MASKATVLVVDDDPGIRETIPYIFEEEADIDLLVADGGRHALDILAEREVDVMVADYNMPGMNGMELIRAVRQRSPDTVRLLLSGKIELTDVYQAFNEGMISQFIIKPWHEDGELIAAVRTALRTRQALIETAELVKKFDELRKQVDVLGQAILSASLSLRRDSVVAQEGEFLRRSLQVGD